MTGKSWQFLRGRPSSSLCFLFSLSMYSHSLRPTVAGNAAPILYFYTYRRIFIKFTAVAASPIYAYKSTLAAGRTLPLFTLRPPHGQAWSVYILEGPHIYSHKPLNEKGKMKRKLTSSTFSNYVPHRLHQLLLLLLLLASTLEHKKSVKTRWHSG